VTKSIVYLIGAGATQAEVSYLGAKPISLLMQDTELFGEGVSSGILRRADAISRFGDSSVDVEKLISLMSACGVNSLTQLADSMRAAYFHEIRQRLIDTQVIDQPRLAIGLLEMHKDPTFASEVESLSGLITTNHDGLFQIASQQVHDAIDVGFNFRSTDFEMAEVGRTPPVLQLHGSFTWRFGVPTTISKLGMRHQYSRDTTWLPPAILKESKSYPFNRLTGMAYELLAQKCDVLRVVGASLTQNDWNILSLIFNAQQHRIRTRGAAFRIELIMPHRRGEDLRRECSFLQQLTPIGYLSEGRFDDYKSWEPTAADEKANPFAYWLKEKVGFHSAQKELSVDATNVHLASIRGEVAA
jgi:hypothetical protein